MGHYERLRPPDSAEMIAYLKEAALASVDNRDLILDLQHMHNALLGKSATFVF
jgi:hypothetical protein